MSNTNAHVRINVVIGTHGRAELLKRTLESLSQAKRPEGFDRVWVLENGSDAGARQTCDAMKDRLPLRYVHLEQAGKSRALQHALEQIKTGLVIFMDDDVRTTECVFQSYSQAATLHGERKIYGGPLPIDYQKPPPAWLLEHLPPSVRGWEPQDPKAALIKEHFLGANFAAFAQTILGVGGINLSIGPGAIKPGTENNPVGLETDLQARLREHGCEPVFLPDAKVWHYVPHERCTPQWTLHRHERIWMTFALTNPRYDEKPWLWNAPRWMWRRLLALWIKATTGRLIPNAHKRFEAQLLYYQWRGILRGIRLRHARQTPESPQNHG